MGKIFSKIRAKQLEVLFWLLLLLYVGAVFFLTLYSFQNSSISLPRYLLGIEMDKIIHFTLFFPFTTLFFMALKLNYLTKEKEINNYKLLALVFFVGILLSTTTEYLQLTTTFRSFEVGDLIANWLSITVSSLLLLILISMGLFSTRGS